MFDMVQRHGVVLKELNLTNGGAENAPPKINGMHSNFLRYLDEVARQGSIRKAANVLNISSTSVNRKLLSVESKFGVKLFDRSPRGVEITAAGKILLEHCRKTLYDFNNVKMMLEDIRDLRAGHLSIQTVDSFTFYVLPHILRKFSHKYPEITLSVTTAMSDEISNVVASGDVDIGISFTNMIHPDVRIILEKPAPFGIIIRPDHPLAEKSVINTEDLSGYSLVRTVGAHSHNSILYHEISSATINLSTCIFTNTLTIAKQIILSNRAIGIYTKIGFLEEIENRDLVFIPFALKSLNKYKAGLTISASSSIGPVKRLFLTAAESVFKTLNFES